jgi:hypothetical protein
VTEAERLLDLGLWALEVITSEAAEAGAVAVVALPKPRTEAAVAAALRAGFAESRDRLARTRLASGAMH